MTTDPVSSVNCQNGLHIKYTSENGQHNRSVMSALAKHIPDTGDISRIKGC
jgi:hypothetical protein